MGDTSEEYDDYTHMYTITMNLLLSLFVERHLRFLFS